MLGVSGNVVCVGSGNVATHLAKALSDSSFNIIQVYSRNEEHAACLARPLNAKYTSQVSDIVPDADYYLMALADNAISQVSAQMNVNDGLVCHTSGSADMNLLSKFKNYGVFYPLQTFTKSGQTDFSKIPVLIEANTFENESLLLELAFKMGTQTYLFNSEKRRLMHLAAIFVNNFSNHLCVLAEDILNENNLPFDLLRPLINETANRIAKNLPSAIQTGPAVRNDIHTINAHLSLLKNNPFSEEIYKLMTRSIQNTIQDYESPKD